MRSLFWVVPVALFFLNPSFACSDEPEFQFGAEEMRAAVEGDWTFTITPDGGAEMQVTVRIEQAATATGGATSRGSNVRLVRAAHACGNRTLVKNAAACSDVTEMPLTLTYLSGDASFSSATMSGNFRVYGLSFSSGMLELKIGSFQILSQVKADRSLNDPRLGPQGTLGTLSVSRP